VLYSKGYLGCAIAAVAAPALAADYVATTTTQARNFLDTAVPGDTVLLAPGVYDNLTIEDRPGVTLRSQDPANPAIIRPEGDSTPALYIGHPLNVTVSDLIIEFTPTTAVSHGVSVSRQDMPTFGDGLTLQNLTIRLAAPTTGGGNWDGIHISDTHNFLIQNCTVENWGSEGSGIDLVGAYDGIIRNNVLTGAFNNTGTGIQMKGGARNIIVRANRLDNAGNRAINFGGLTDLEFFAPGVNYEASNLIAEGNVITHGFAPVAFDASIGCTFRFNLSYDTDRWMGRILPEDPPAAGFPTQVVGGKFIGNRFVWARDFVDTDTHSDEYINTSDPADYDLFSFVGNQWYKRTDPARSTPWFPPGLSHPTDTFGQDPQVDPEHIVPWAFNWGLWLVNASLAADSYPLGESFYLASPGEGGSLDLGAAFPLVGNWTFQPVDSSITLGAMSDAVLVRSSLIPEAGGSLLAGAAILGSTLQRRRRASR